MEIQAKTQSTMSEIRKLLRLTPNAYAVTLPNKYREALKLGFRDHVVISLLDAKTIAIRKLAFTEKP